MLFLSQNGITSASADIVVIIFLALFTLAVFAAAITFLCKYINVDKDEKTPNAGIALAIILLVGFAVRLVFGLCIIGYREDYNVFINMFSHLKTNGLRGYYNGDATTVLYPVVYFVYVIFGGLGNMLTITEFARGAQFVVRLPLIIADLLAAVAIYKLARKYINGRVALTLCAFVCVCPIFFMGSSIWTTPIVFTVMFAAYACYYLACKKYGTTILFGLLASFSSKEGIYLFPAIACFAIYHFVRAIRNIVKNKPKGDEVLSSDYAAVITVPLSLILSLLLCYLVGLFMIASYNRGFFRYIQEFLIAPLVKWDTFTYNGASIYTLFGKNGFESPARFPKAVVTVVFALIITATVCVVYLSKRNRATMVMLAAYGMFTMQVYYPGSTAISMTSALLLILAAYVLVKDKRLLIILGVAGLAFVINSASVLANAGYLNNLEAHYFDLAQYTGSTLMSGKVKGLPIACAVFTVLSHLYFTIVAVNVGMTGQKKMLEPADGFGDSMVEFFSIKKAK